MDLLKRALATAANYSFDMLASTASAWFPNAGTETLVSVIAAPDDGGRKQMQGGGFLGMQTEQITIIAKLADMPGATAPQPSSRFYFASTTTRLGAERYQVESVRSVNHLATHIEIKGTKSV